MDDMVIIYIYRERESSHLVELKKKSHPSIPPFILPNSNIVIEGDTGAAWDVKGTMLLQAGGKLSDAHFCFERALQLRPTDVLIRKHLKDCEALVNQGSNSGPPMSPKGPKKSKSKKEKKEKKEKKLGPRPPSFDEDEK
jgi:hypothetical protein